MAILFTKGKTLNMLSSTISMLHKKHAHCFKIFVSFLRMFLFVCLILFLFEATFNGAQCLLQFLSSMITFSSAQGTNVKLRVESRSAMYKASTLLCASVLHPRLFLYQKNDHMRRKTSSMGFIL